MYEELKRIALSRFKEALVKAIDSIDLTGAELENVLFPLWRDAVHDIVKETQICPCAKVHDGSCFLSLTADAQKTFFPDEHSLGFAAFQKTFIQGRALALSILVQNQLEGIH